MSWWDTSQLTSFASTAIKKAQKKIDKVLDIPVEDETNETVTDISENKTDENKAANATWSAWGTPSFLHSTPKCSSFSEPTTSTKRSSPAPQTEPPRSNSPLASLADQPMTPGPDPDILSTLNDEPVVESTPKVRADKYSERRQARRQRSHEKPPSTTKKLGATKLGAIKVQRIDLAADIPPSDNQELVKAQSGSAVYPISTEISEHVILPEHSAAISDITEASPGVTDTPASSASISFNVDSITPTTEVSVGASSAPVTSSETISTTVTVDVTTQASKAFSSNTLILEVSADCTSDTATAAAVANNLDSETVAEETSVLRRTVSSAGADVQEETIDGSIVTSDSQSLFAESKLVTDNIDASNEGTDHETGPTEMVVSSPGTASPERHVDLSADSSNNATLTQDISSDAANNRILADREIFANTSLIEMQPDYANSSRDTLDPSSGLLLRSVDGDVLLIGADSSTDSPVAGEDHIPDNPHDMHRESDSDVSASESLEVAGADIITKSGSSDGTVTDQLTDLQVQLGSEEISAAAGSDDSADDTQMTGSTTPSLMEQSVSSDNSYVKCELTSSYLSNVHDPNGHFRNVRASSEFSDFETATSSDIEIISMASTYGDGNGESRLVDDFVPLSRSMFKTKMRDISPDEVSISSSQVSPSSGSDDMVTVADVPAAKSASDLPLAAIPDPHNPLDATTLLKKLSQLTEILEVRETKLVAMSREHGELLEVNAHLKRRIEQMEETNGDLDLVKDEFGQRLHELERKLQQSLREKELVKKQLMTTQEELHNRAGTSGKMQRMVEDKDEQISSLMAEGEKLAKQQLQSNNLIKKLRKKEKEQEELSRALREKADHQNSELERLKAVLDSKNQNETKHSELIKQLNGAVSTYQVDNQRLKADAEDALEKQKRAESAVDNSYKEIAELHKSVAAKETKIKEMTLGNEAHMKEELQMALEKKHKEALRDADHLTNQIEDMQLTINRMENEHHRREECLRQEQQDLLEKLEKSDKRNDELTDTVSAATRPLLRQIENLQSSYSAQSSSWEKLERSLTERLAESQNQLASATEKERLSSESSMELSSRINVLETHLSSLKQEKSKLTAELEMSKIRLSTLQDERNGSIAQLEIYKANIESDRIETKKTQTLLENKLDQEKSKLEAEKRQYLVLMEQLNEKDQQIHELSMSRVRNTPSPSSMGEDSRATPVMRRSMKQDELLERALSTSTIMGSSLYDNMRNHGTTSLLESLESQVKQREGEITQLQADIVEHEKTRESLTKEMVKLTEENSSQESKIKQLSKVQQQYKELNGRYQALLQMYGEKEEQVNELRMDLVDVKQMYKQQVRSASLHLIHARKG